MISAAQGTAALPAAAVVQAVAAAAAQQNRDGLLLVGLSRAARQHADAGALAPGQITHLCAGFASLGFFDARFNAAAARAMLPQLRAFDPAELCDTLHAYGLARHFDFELMAAALAHLKANARCFDAPSLAKV
ncbi:MAG: hypothetical protein J3K34DRAFT_116629 [Monoraphidium minutum]|nr:MAG: hypothetical protein J3K34DRAFT_116629 [Monoraphidium minutum]